MTHTTTTGPTAQRPLTQVDIVAANASNWIGSQIMTAYTQLRELDDISADDVIVLLYALTFAVRASRQLPAHMANQLIDRLETLQLTIDRSRPCNH